MKKTFMKLLVCFALLVSFSAEAQLVNVKRTLDHYWFAGDNQVRFGSVPNATINYTGGNLVIDIISGGGVVSIPDGLSLGASLIDVDSDEAFLVRKSGDSADVFRVDTFAFDEIGTSGETVEILHNGNNGIAGGGTQASILRVRGKVSSDTQSGRFRGIDSLIVYEGNAGHSGLDGQQVRAQNNSISWNSTGPATELVGTQNFIAAGGGVGVTSGLIDLAIGQRTKCGFNTNDGGTFTVCIGVRYETPKSTDATHLITSNYGSYYQDMGDGGVGVSGSWGIYMEDQSGYSIQTGVGDIEFGDDVNIVNGALVYNDINDEGTCVNGTPDAITIDLSLGNRHQADQEDADCDITFSNGSAGEIHVLEMEYAGDFAWTIAAGGHFNGDTFDDSNCSDFQATAVDGDKLVMFVMAIDSDTVMRLGCEYHDQ